MWLGEAQLHGDVEREAQSLQRLGGERLRPCGARCTCWAVESVRVDTFTTGVLISAMPWSADHSAGQDRISKSQSISSANPHSRPTEMELVGEFDGGGTVEAAREVRHGAGAHPAPQDVRLRWSRDLERRSAVDRRDARDRHRPGGVDHGVVDPDLPEELATATRVAEQVADLLLVGVVPRLLERGDVGRASDHEAEHERVAGLKRNARRRVRLAGDAGHLDGQRVQPFPAHTAP